MRFSVYQISRKGGREKNEDRMGYCYTRESGLFALADGMGGHPEGEVASQLALQTLAAAYQREAKPSLKNPIRFLQDAILAGHHQLLRYATERSLVDTPRTTVVACVLQDNAAYWAHCGDSRMYHFRGTRTMSVSGDHSLVAELVRKGRLDDRSALRHPQRNVLLSCLGSDREPRIDYGREESPLGGDAFLLCSDGLWAHFTEFELASTLQEFPARAAAERLVALGRERAGGTGDNISLAVVKLVEARTDAATPTRPAIAR